MIERPRRMLAGRPGEATPSGAERLHLAAAALLVEAALVDGAIDAAERAAIARVLAGRFALSAAEAADLLAEAEAGADGAVGLYRPVSAIRDALAADERVAVVEMLWEVVYADAVLHDYEANLLRRVAGLLHVGDAESGAVRKRVLARLAAAAGKPPAA